MRLETMEQKNARNGRVQDQYDELIRNGRHGHYETMFRIVRLEVEAAVAAERARIAASLRRSGATLPAPEIKGTPESGIITGLCIALTLVEDGPNEKGTRPA